MSRSVLVINPWVTDFKLYDEWMHPVGLYFLISLLKHNGFEVHFFNCLQQGLASKQKRFATGDFEHREFPKPEKYRLIKRRYKLYGQSRETFSSFLASLRPPEAILIGSQMTYWLPGLVETAGFVTPIVVGGVSARLIPEHIAAALPGAHVFRGSLFDQSSAAWSGIPVVAQLRSDGWEPSLLDAYRTLPFSRHGPVLTSFGCPRSCSYCASGILQASLVVRKTETVISEIEYLHDFFKVEHFALFDDALLLAPEKNSIPFMKAVRDRRMGVSFHTPNGLQVNHLSPELCDLMRQTGFRTLRFGYESSDARYLRYTGAKASRTDISRGIQVVKDSGFAPRDVGVYVMAGFPGQSPADVVGEIEFVASLGVNVKPVFLSPVPHTKMFHDLLTVVPEIADDPLCQNDSFFITRLPGWTPETVQQVIDAAKKHNARIDTVL
jgi:hypothetical protein